MTSETPQSDAQEPTNPGSGGRDAVRRSSRRPARAPSARSARDRSTRRFGGRNLWIAVAAVVVLGCALSTCGALAGTGFFGSERSRTEQAMQSADAHWQKAIIAMEQSASSLERLRSAVGPTASVAVASATVEASTAVASAQMELKMAGSAIAGLPESKLKTSYRGAIVEAGAALAGVDSMLVSLSSVNRVYGAAALGARFVRSGTTHLAAAIAATNSDRYPDVRREALAASADFGQADKAFAAGQTIDRTAGFDKALLYTAKLATQAGLLTQLADSGAAKQIARYNALASRQATARKQLAALAPPTILSRREAVVAKVDQQRSAIRQHLDKAQKLYDQAQAAFRAMTK